MMRNLNDYGVITSEWLNEIANIDGDDPNSNYVGGLAFSAIREYKPKDETLGNADVPAGTGEE